MARSNNKWGRMPLILLAAVEVSVLISTAFVSAYFLDDAGTQQHVFLILAARSSLTTIVFMTLFVAMGLYQFNQRLNFLSFENQTVEVFCRNFFWRNFI